MIAVIIFSLISALVAGLFIFSIRAQQKSLATGTLLDQSSYLLEYMSRAIRMAKKDLGGICIPAKLNYQKTRGGSGIKFLNYKDQCQEFFLQGGKIKEVKEGQENFLTSDDLEVTVFNIGPAASWDQDDNDQPRVTLFLEIKTRAVRPEHQVKIKLQTTISQRNLDILQ